MKVHWRNREEKNLKMNLNKMKLIRIALLMVIGSLLGFALLAMVFCLPLNGSVDAQGTADIFRSEGNRPSVVPGYRSTTGDNYTDALMIAEALYAPLQEGKSPLDQAVYVYRKANSDSASRDLADMLEGKPMQWEISYTRYWHGFLVLLRPLLMVFSYADLRVLMCMAQMILFALLLVTLTRQNRMKLIIPFVTVILTIAPTGTLVSLQYFSSYALMMLGVLAVLYGDEWLSRNERYGFFFLILGMLTCYFDFLTYPLVTLFIPLILVLYLHAHEQHLFRFFVGACLLWGVGYAGFWAMKWLVGSLIVGDDLIYNAYHHAKYQVSMADVSTGSRTEAIAANLSVVARPAFVLLYAGAFCAYLLPILCRRRDMGKLFAKGRWVMGATALVPFAWWLVAVSHSVVHSLFTYRLIAITVFSLMLWVDLARDEDIIRDADKK